MAAKHTTRSIAMLEEVDMSVIYEAFLALEDVRKGKGVQIDAEFLRKVHFLHINRPKDINLADEAAYNRIIDSTMNRLKFSQKQVDAINNIYNVQAQVVCQ